MASLSNVLPSEVAERYKEKTASLGFDPVQADKADFGCDPSLAQCKPWCRGNFQQFDMFLLLFSTFYQRIQASLTSLEFVNEFFNAKSCFQRVTLISQFVKRLKCEYIL